MVHPAKECKNVNWIAERLVIFYGIVYGIVTIKPKPTLQPGYSYVRLYPAGAMNPIPQWRCELPHCNRAHNLMGRCYAVDGHVSVSEVIPHKLAG